MKRVLLKIDRGPMEKTTVAVFPWEQPLLEEIHGSVAEVTVAEVLDMKSPTKIEMAKLKHAPAHGLSMEEQTLRMLEVDPELDPMNDPDTEWARLENFYGRHPKIDLSVAEKVFGGRQQFKMWVKEFVASGAPPDREDDESASADVAIADMTAKQLRARLKELGIEAAKSASRDELAEMLVEKEAA